MEKSIFLIFNLVHLIEFGMCLANFCLFVCVCVFLHF